MTAELCAISFVAGMLVGGVLMYWECMKAVRRVQDRLFQEQEDAIRQAQVLYKR